MHQLGIQQIEDRLAELANNNSMAARAEISRLQDDLAKRQQNLDNFLFENNRKNQENAYKSELEREREAIDAQKRNIDAELAEYERSHQAKLGMIEAQQKANDAAAERIQSQIEELNKSIQNSGDLTRMAMARIDKEMNEDADAFLKKLLDYNRVYRTGLDEDVTGAWRRFIDTVNTGNETALDQTRRIMQEILDLTNRISSAQANMTGFSGTTGVRDFFEGQGRSVGWNSASNQFSVDGQWFDASGFNNMNGSLQATYNQLLELEKQLSRLPGYSSGAYIKEDQLAVVHAGELILNAEQTKKFKELMKTGTDFSGYNPASSIMNSSTMNNVANNITTNNGAPEIKIENTFNGITSENFESKVVGTMKNIADDAINGLKGSMNRFTKASGLGARVRTV